MRRLGSVHLAPARNARDLPEDHLALWQEMHSIYPARNACIHLAGKKCIRSSSRPYPASTIRYLKKFAIRRISFKKIGVIDYPAPLDIYVGSSAIEGKNGRESKMETLS